MQRMAGILVILLALETTGLHREILTRLLRVMVRRARLWAEYGQASGGVIASKGCVDEIDCTHKRDRARERERAPRLGTHRILLRWCVLGERERVFFYSFELSTPSRRTSRSSPWPHGLAFRRWRLFLQVLRLQLLPEFLNLRSKNAIMRSSPFLPRFWIPMTFALKSFSKRTDHGTITSTMRYFEIGSSAGCMSWMSTA